MTLHGRFLDNVFDNNVAKHWYCCPADDRRKVMLSGEKDDIASEWTVQRSALAIANDMHGPRFTSTAQTHSIEARRKHIARLEKVDGYTSRLADAKLKTFYTD